MKRPAAALTPLVGQPGLPDEPAGFTTVTRRGTSPPWAPAADFLVASDRFVVVVDVPGVAATDLHIELVDGELRICGSVNSQPAESKVAYLCLERPCGPFRLTFLLPETVPAGDASATLRQGVLKITLPRSRQPAHVRTIEIRVEES